MNKKILVLGIIFLFLISIYSGCMEETQKKKSNTIYVDVNGNGDFISIQDAINASDDGNIIVVKKGTYHERLNINKSINLVGEDKNTTIISMIDTNNIIPLISLNTNYSSIENFTFNNGSVSLISCIVLTLSSNNTIKNNNIIGFNHGIYITGSSEKNTISDNFVLNNIYGIRIKGCYYNNINRNNIKNNDRGV